VINRIGCKYKQTEYCNILLEHRVIVFIVKIFNYVFDTAILIEFMVYSVLVETNYIQNCPDLIRSLHYIAYCVHEIEPRDICKDLNNIILSS